MRSLSFLPALLGALTVAGTVEGARKPANSVLLSNVQSLTLRQGLKTSHRRAEAIPQLACVGGNAKSLYEIDVMRCKNAGSDYDDDNIQWTCTAQLPEDFKLGSTDVVCEGYESPDDPYILKGSCGVEYRLVLTEKGEKKYGTGKKGWFSGPSTQEPAEQTDDSTSGGAVAVLFWIIFLAVVAYMLYSACIAGGGGARAPNTHRPNYGGGGGGDDDDPPPPYDYPPAPKQPRTPKPPQYRPYPAQPRTYTQPQPQQAGSWRPGFWTGTAAGAGAGAAAGYAAGRATRADPNPPAARGGGWFNAGEGSSTRSGSSGSSSSSPSAARYESTGFGSTRRR